MLLVSSAPFVLLPAYPALVLAALRRDGPALAAAALVVAAHVLVVVPALHAPELPPVLAQAPRIRVAVANLYVLNRDPRATGVALRELDLDVLVVPELTATGLAGLRASGLLADLPHAVVPGQAQRETVGLFSRRPLRDVAVRSGAGRSLPQATVTVAGTPVRLLSTHILPPIWLLEREWRLGLRTLARDARSTALPVVVLGDLNGDRDAGAVRALLRTGLRDVHDERGRGLARTWPAAVPLLHLDHVLVRDGQRARLGAVRVEEVRLPGTDHRAVVADLAVATG